VDEEQLQNMPGPPQTSSSPMPMVKDRNRFANGLAGTNVAGSGMPTAFVSRSLNNDTRDIDIDVSVDVASSIVKKVQSDLSPWTERLFQLEASQKHGDVQEHCGGQGRFSPRKRTRPSGWPRECCNWTREKSARRRSREQDIFRCVVLGERSSAEGGCGGERCRWLGSSEQAESHVALDF
jgi:hypothetical protein